jgi:hypothetical protein
LAELRARDRAGYTSFWCEAECRVAWVVRAIDFV